MHVALCDSAREDGSQCLAQLVPHALFHPFAARLSPDGKRIVYTVAGPVGTQVWLYDLADRQVRPITSAAGSRHDPVWSPDASRIAYWGSGFSTGTGENVQGIAVLDLRSGRERVVFPRERGGTAQFPDWTAEGQILFRVEGFGYGIEPAEVGADAADPEGVGTWIMDADGRDVRLLLHGDRGYVAMSPNEKSIAWMGSPCDSAVPHGNRESGLRIADIDGSGERCLLTVPGQTRRTFSWTPDGHALLYAGPTRDEARGRVYRVSLSGGPPAPLGGPEGDITALTVTGTGDVAVTLFRPRSRVATLPAAGGVPRPVSEEPAPNAVWPTWLPNARALAFTTGPWRSDHWWSESGFAVADLDEEGRQVGELRYLMRPDSQRVIAGAAVSPDGALLATVTVPAFGGAGTGGYTLHRLDAPGAPEVFVQSADVLRSPGPPGWSPDSRRLATPASADVLPSSVDRRLTGSKVMGGGLLVTEVESAMLASRRSREHPERVLALEGFPGRAILPRFSPDGREIAFSNRYGPDGRAGVYVVSAEGGPIQTLTEFASFDVLSGPEWSRSGESLYFSALANSGFHRIHRLDRRSGRVEALSSGDSHALHPRISPDGQTLAVTLWDAPTELWVIPA